MSKLEINVGYTTQTNALAVVLNDMEAKITDQGTFEVEITAKTGTEQEVKAMIEQLCPYGNVKIS